MLVSIDKFRAVDSFTHNFTKPISIIYGSGHIGKTSILKAIEACATGRPVPFSVNEKKTAENNKRMCKRGTIGGSIQLDAVKIHYPSGSVNGNSDYSVLDSWKPLIPELSGKELERRITDVIERPVDNEEWVRELMKIEGLQDSSVKKIVSLIASLGVESVYNKYKQQAKDDSVKWNYITGVHVGNRKDFTWNPDNWNPALEDTSSDELLAEIKRLNENRDFLNKNAGYSEFELKQCNDLFSKVDSLKMDLLNKEKELNAKNKALPSIQKKLQDELDKCAEMEKRFSVLSSIKNDKVKYICPECKCNLTLIDGSLSTHKYRSLTKAEEKEYTELEIMVRDSLKCIETLRNEIAGIDRDCVHLNVEAKDISRDIEKAVKAGERAKEIEFIGSVDNSEDIKELDVQIEELKWQIKSIEDKKNADKLANQIKLSHEITTLLAPEGYRKSKALFLLDKINSVYLPYGIKLDYDYNITINDMSYNIDCSASEKYMINSVFRVVESIFRGFNLVILDDMERLDDIDKKRFLKYAYTMHKKHGIYFIIGHMGGAIGVSESICEEIEYKG